MRSTVSASRLVTDHASFRRKEQIDDGYPFTRRRSRLLRTVLCLHTRLRQALTGETTMTLDYILSGAVTVFLTVYLTYALIRPERF